MFTKTNMKKIVNCKTDCTGKWYKIKIEWKVKSNYMYY